MNTYTDLDLTLVPKLKFLHMIRQLLILISVFVIILMATSSNANSYSYSYRNKH